MARCLLPLLFATCALAFSSARATLTYDLRLMGGGKAMTNLNTSDVIDLELWAVVTGAAGNPAQEGFKEGYVNILSDGNSNVRGNLSATLTTAFAASGSQNGTSQDLDSDGDKDVGSKLAFRSDGGNPAPNGDYLYANAAGMQTSSGTPITNGREFLLARLTFTVSGIINPLDPTVTRLYLFVANFKSPIDIEAVWQQDGISSSMTPTPGGTFPNAFPEVGAPVQLRAIPEPSTAILLLAAGGVVLGAVRPRRL